MKLFYTPIILLIFLIANSCKISNPDSFILQMFETNKYKVIITGSIGSSAKEMVLEKDGQNYIKSLENIPVQVIGVSKDSIFLCYFVFSSKFRDTIEYEMVDSKFVLVKQYRPVISTNRGEEHSIDSVVKVSKNLFLFSKGVLVGSTDQNSLQFDGKSFFKRHFDSVKRSTTFTTFFITDDKLVASYLF